MAAEFCLRNISIHARKVLLHAVNLPLRRKLCYGFLSPLKIHRLRPGSNPRTLGPVASTLTTSPPRVLYVCIYANSIMYQRQELSSLIPYWCNKVIQTFRKVMTKIWISSEHISHVIPHFSGHSVEPVNFICNYGLSLFVWMLELRTNIDRSLE
jgi:hypothetical protein